MLVANDPNNNPIELQADANGNLKTSVVGSLAKEIMVCNALAIADTVNHDYTIDVSGISGRKALLIRNNLNQNVDVKVFAFSADESSVTFAITGNTASILANNGALKNGSDFPGLLDPVQKLKIRLSCATAPTTGAVTVVLVGV